MRDCRGRSGHGRDRTLGKIRRTLRAAAIAGTVVSIELVKGLAVLRVDMCCRVLTGSCELSTRLVNVHCGEWMQGGRWE